MANPFEEIHSKYKHREDHLNQQLAEIDEKLGQLKLYEVANDANGNYIIHGIPTADDAKDRNREIIKSISLAKARLRSRAIYNPAEVTWCGIMQKYRDAPSLPVTTWQCCTDHYNLRDK